MAVGSASYLGFAIWEPYQQLLSLEAWSHDRKLPVRTGPSVLGTPSHTGQGIRSVLAHPFCSFLLKCRWR